MRAISGWSARRLLPALALLLACLPAKAQVVQDEQLWLNVTLFGSLGSFVYFMEAQPRFGDGIAELDQLILRPAIGWAISERFKVYQGYARVQTALAGGGFSGEDRSFQQLDWEIGTFERAKVSSRTRFEQRILSTGRDIGLRLRQQLRVALPLSEPKDGLAVVAWTEAFVALNDTDWGGPAGFDRVRTFVGLGVPLVDKSTVEIGYLNQTVDPPGRPIEIDHIVALTFSLRP